MSIAQISQRDVVVIDEHASIQEAAQLMRERHIGALVITSGDRGERRLVGMVTDRDLALKVVAEGVAPQTAVGQLAGGSLVAVPHTASTAEAAQTMREAGVRRLLLVDRERQLVGIVTLDDLIASYADQLGDLADALDRGIELEVEAMAGQAPAETPEPVMVPSELAAGWRHVMEP
ncbi:MAG: CBS domain-containing protein [Pseudomonadota bacterium]